MVMDYHIYAAQFDLCSFSEDFDLCTLLCLFSAHEYTCELPEHSGAHQLWLMGQAIFYPYTGKHTPLAVTGLQEERAIFTLE